MTEIDPGNYKTLSFDVYGTLIDWENGILGYLQPLLESYDVHVIDTWVLEQFAEMEPQIQGDGGSYRQVLARILERFANRLAFIPGEDALAGFPNSIEYWQPFADTVPALQALGEKFELVVLSNRVPCRMDWIGIAGWDKLRTSPIYLNDVTAHFAGGMNTPAAS